ncbi:MAG: XdhC family protein [Chloroflexi bacterium]|nr:XdhC family protein [Chloroflexota bacterium]
MIEIYQELVNVISRREKAILATVISSRGSAPREAGAKMLIKQDGSFIGTVGGGGVEKNVLRKAMEIMGAREPQVVHFDLTGKPESVGTCGGQMDVLLEPVLAPETVYIFGAGHISQPTAAIAKMLDFRVIVIDPRPEFNNSDRFPTADACIVEDYAQACPKLSVDEDSYIVICTPGHVTDEPCLKFAVGSKAKYVGMMGSRRKILEVKERMVQQGVPRELLDKIHAPIGVDIGAETPAELAVSIVAEIIKVRRMAPVRAGVS